MIKINLLPRKIKKDLLKFDLYIFVIILVMTLLVLGGLFYKNTQDIVQQKQAIENAKKEITNLESLYKEFMRIENAKKEIERRIKTINDLKDRRILTARTLYDLTNTVKENVWLKTFKKDEERFELEGRSLDNGSISDFIEGLSQIPYMRNVELRIVENVVEEGIAVKKFIIQGNIVL